MSTASSTVVGFFPWFVIPVDVYQRRQLQVAGSEPLHVKLRGGLVPSRPSVWRCADSSGDAGVGC